MARTSLTIDMIPLFSSDEQIGEAVLGYERRAEFSGLATVAERSGMPKISAFWGGRYVPAVKAFLDSEHGLGEAPMQASGVEGKWPTRRRRRSEP